LVFSPNVSTPRYLPNCTIIYHDKIYDFEYGKAVNYPNPYYLLFFEITPDVVDMLEDIILKSVKTLDIPSIPDPMAQELSHTRNE
jgi:hypothetical protein